MNATTTTRRPYEKPTLVRHVGGMLNKFGRSGFVPPIEAVDGVRIRDLIAQHGSPLFVISEQKVRSNVRRLRDAFTRRYPKVRIGWSYKTNYLGAVCGIMHQEGSWAEVVSDFEYEKARDLGVPGDKILFNGPGKNRAILERAIKEGAHLHVDHFDELFLIEELAQELDTEVNLTIRLNMDTHHAPVWGRFGFSIEAGQAFDAARRIASCDKLHLTGLHSHVGTFILDKEAYAEEIKSLVAFMNEAEAITGDTIETLDIGGGFASKNALQGTYLPPEQVVPSYEQYAETVCGALMAATRGRKALPTLVLETGRALIDDTEILVTSVVANKRLPNGRRAVVVDAGVGVLFTAFWYNHALHPTRTLTGQPEECAVFGPLCMNIDVVRQTVVLPPLPVGEPLVVTPVGAYNNTQWMQFIQYRPAVVMVHPEQKVSVVRRAEKLQDVIGCEAVPEHLGAKFPEGMGR
ncbi:MAG: diaminopimelate decarboxylase [Alphaproteobacteria bacterium CG_4_10_14_0_2_um_filter_63_37]|nr:MAG: diaminopimelate decarboxylase [Proteobacteria bacterium CG1_02_64_396]PJA25218.1 MAG: diaminopimelate decarboxylase [Alphaproteobacteria bacterium CG_4_10_14_0_2_um_filter_63_37]